MNTVSHEKSAGTRPQARIEASNSRSDPPACARNISTLTTMIAIVTTGVVREGITSRSGITCGSGPQYCVC